MAWIVLGWPGGTRPPCWPRSVEWNVAISLARCSVASVSAAQATCQSWAWTMCGTQSPRRVASWTRWWLADATRATSSSSGSHGRSARARSTRTPPTLLSAGAPGCDSVSSTTSWPDRASAWLSPSTWAAIPPTERGGNSQVSIRTRIGRTLGRFPSSRRRSRPHPALKSAPDTEVTGRLCGGHGSTRLDSDLRPVVMASATLGAAVGVFGVAFGVGAVAAGGSVVQACVMSLLVFTGASQFSAVSVVAAGGSTAAALGGAMLLAARNGVYGLAMSRVLGGSLATRLVAAQLTIDESTAMATAQTDVRAQRDGVLGHRASGLRRSGTSARSSARWPARRSTRRRTASTPPSRPASWRWWRRSCAHRLGRLGRRCSAPAICLVLDPVRAGRGADPVRVGGASSSASPARADGSEHRRSRRRERLGAR